MPLAREALQSGVRAVQRHPRRVAAAVVVALGGFAVTAFGIAPMAADADLPPTRTVVEELGITDLDHQLDALAGHGFELHHTTLTRGSDTVDALLKRLGVHDPQAAAHLRRHPEARRLLAGRGGKSVQVRIAADGSLLELVARHEAVDPAQAASHFSRWTLTRQAGRFIDRIETVPLQAQVRLGSGTVKSSLWEAVDDARLPDAIASQMIEIFDGDLDFHRQLQRGDTFSVVYETLTADDQPVTWADATGRVLAAEFVNRGRRLQAMWFAQPRSGKGAYFTPDGKSRQRTFLASPVPFSRVTSGFAMRMHPIMNTWRAHHGVDYAAPTGTPVKTVGDGTVVFAGRMSGYGNVVEIEHPGRRQSTVYAHLSRIHVKKGQQVQQGQQIGAVGATGWATGPHLHFEFRVDGRFQDPLRMAAAQDTLTLDAAARPQFNEWAGAARQQLAAAGSMTRFRGDAE